MRRTIDADLDRSLGSVSLVARVEIGNEGASCRAPRDPSRMNYANDAPRDDELESLARDVSYEFWMALLAVQRLADLGAPRANDLEWSAWVEVLLLHSRVLAHFFRSQARGDDVVASQYVGDWDGTAPDIEWIHDYVMAINKRVMHLTAYRHRQRERADAPEVDELILRLTRTMIAFLEALPPERRTWFPIDMSS